MEVMDYEMEEPRPPPGPLRSYLNCPYFTRPVAGPPMNNITGTVQGQNALPPFFPHLHSNFPRPGLYNPNNNTNHTNIPPHIAAVNNQFPQEYEFRNSFQGTFDAQRARPAIRREPGQTGVQTGAAPGNMARHDGLEGFNPAGTTAMSSQAPSNPTTFTRPPLFPGGLNVPSRHENPYQSSVLSPAGPLHQATATHHLTFGPNRNHNNNNNNNTTRALPPPFDPTRYGLPTADPSTQEGLFTINSTAQPQPVQRQPPSYLPTSNAPNGNSNTSSPSSHPGHLPVPAPQFQNLTRRWELPRTRGQARFNGPNVVPPPTRPSNYPGPADFYPPTSYAGMLGESDPMGRLQEHMTGSIDPPPNRPTGDNPGVSTSAADHNPRMNALYDYIRTGELHQRLHDSYQSNGLTDPGQPLRDFNQFLASLRQSVAREDFANYDQRIRDYAGARPSPIRRAEPDRASARATAEQLLTQAELRVRQHELAILMQQARVTGTTITTARESSSRRATAKAIEDLVKVEITSLGEDDRSCSICMEPFGEEEPTQGKIEYPVKMPCGHIFGMACIRTWLSEHCTCPSCRRKVESENVRPPPMPIDFGTTLERVRNAGDDNESDGPTGRMSRRRRTQGLRAGNPAPPPGQSDITAISAARTPDRLGARYASRAHDGVGHRPLGPSGLSRRWVPSPDSSISRVGESSVGTNNTNTNTNARMAAAADGSNFPSNISSRNPHRPRWMNHPTAGGGNMRSTPPAPRMVSPPSGTGTSNSGSPRRVRRPVRTRGGPSSSSAGNNISNTRTMPRSTLFRIDSTVPETPTRSRREDENGSTNLITNATNTTNANNNNNNTTIPRPRLIRMDLEALRRIGDELDGITGPGPGPLNDTLDMNMGLADEPLMTFSDEEESGGLE